MVEHSAVNRRVVGSSPTGETNRGLYNGLLIAMTTIPPVINNEQVQELPENVLGFINDYLKDKRHELQGVSISPDEV